MSETEANAQARAVGSRRKKESEARAERWVLRERRGSEAERQVGV